MKKIFSAILAAALVVSSLAVSTAAHKDFKNLGEVPTTDEKITLDGKLDDIYKQGFTMDIATRTDGKTGGATGKAYLVYSGNTMYCFVDVKDPEVCPIDPAKFASAFWTNEGAEFTLDYKNDGSTRHKYMAVYDGNKMKAGDAKEEDFEVKGTNSATGWTIEYKVTMPADIKAGAGLGISILLDDMTDGGKTRGIIRPVQSAKPGDNEVAKFDYIVLGSKKVSLPKAAAPATAPATADPMTIALAASALAAAGIVVSKKKER